MIFVVFNNFLQNSYRIQAFRSWSHSIADPAFHSYFTVWVGYRCRLKERRIWENSRLHPHHSLLPTKSEHNSTCGYARGKPKPRVRVLPGHKLYSCLQQSTQPSIRVLIWIGVGKTVIPMLSQVLLCNFIINMLGEPREEG